MLKLAFLGVMVTVQLCSASYQGCYTDQTSSELGNYKDMGTTNKAQTCIAYCLSSGYKYAGLQNGKDCYCGDSYGAHGKVDDTACDVDCTGEDSQKCGGLLKNSIYSTGYLGCFKDAYTRDMGIGFGDYYDMSNIAGSVDVCVTYCKGKNFRYAGVQSAWQCFCSQSYGFYGERPKSDCSMSCQGDTTQKCGGSYRNSVYDTGLDCGCSTA